MNPLVLEDDDHPKSRPNEDSEPTIVVVHHSSKRHCRPRRRGRKSSRSRITIEDLSDSLLVEILAQLPVKSVHQSRSVSKRWRTLTSNPWFVRTFARHQFASMLPSPSRFQLPFTMVNQYPGSEYKEENLLASSPNMFGKRGYSLKFLPLGVGDSGYPTVVAASNDLLLCQQFWSGDYYICNPFTKHWIKLPPAPSTAPLRGGQHKLVDTIIGFVCHSYYKLDDDDDHGGENEYCVIDTPYKYRVVRARFHFLSPFRSLRMEIFSSETCEWSELDLLCPRLLLFQNHLASGGYFSNGRLHWMCKTETEERCVFAYDPFDNDVKMIDLPADLGLVEDVKLGVCRRRLRLLIISSLYDSVPSSSLLRVWELEDYNAGKWRKVHDLPMEPMNINSDREFLPNVIGSISFHPYDGDILFRRLFSHFWSCNMHYRKFKLVINPDEDERRPSSNKIFSLVQPWWPTPVSTLLPMR